MPDQNNSRGSTLDVLQPVGTLQGADVTDPGCRRSPPPPSGLRRQVRLGSYSAARIQQEGGDRVRMAGGREGRAGLRGHCAGRRGLAVGREGRAEGGGLAILREGRASDRAEGRGGERRGRKLVRSQVGLGSAGRRARASARGRGGAELRGRPGRVGRQGQGTTRLGGGGVEAGSLGVRPAGAGPRKLRIPDA